MSISIAIVEDEKNYNNALKKLKVIAQFFNGKNALEELSFHRPDAVMSDIQL